MQSENESPSLYSHNLRVFIHSREWPKGIQFQIVEYPDYLGFRLFRDNFNAFDGEDQKQIALMVKEIMEKVRADGIPIYMEVLKTMEKNNG
jgi:hypothetical protein